VLDRPSLRDNTGVGPKTSKRKDLPMRKRSGRALTCLTAAIAVSTLGLSTAGAATAATHSGKSAITPSCTFNSYCSDPLFNVMFGMQYIVNNANSLFTVGNNIDLQWANNNKPSQDWHVTFQGTVHQLYKLGFISNAMDLRYRNQQAYESQWVPYGVSSNLCRGVAKPAYEGEWVTLQPCGDFPETLWVVMNNYHSWTWNGYKKPYGGNALINGSTTNPSVPYVLTAGGGPTGGNPEAGLQVDQLTSDDGIVNPIQLWCTMQVIYGNGNGNSNGNGSGTVRAGHKPITPPTVGPPTYVANSPNCFPSQQIGWVNK
jgi:hypothetical protein